MWFLLFTYISDVFLVFLTTFCNGLLPLIQFSDDEKFEVIIRKLLNHNFLVVQCKRMQILTTMHRISHTSIIVLLLYIQN